MLMLYQSPEGKETSEVQRGEQNASSEKTAA